MSDFKLCILAAGKGTRMTKYDNMHKALLPLSNKPAISHILEKFPNDIEVVIAVGYKSNQIKSYLNYVYPQRKFQFVDVDNYDRTGSGPGYSLLCCKEHLNCKFIVTAVDTIVAEDIKSVTDNWIGINIIPYGKMYCLYRERQGFYYDENEHNAPAFIGMGGVLNYEDFWSNLANKKTIKNEHQMTNGFENLSNLKVKEYTWYDVGNCDAYDETYQKFELPIVAEKKNETLYIENGKVVKFFSDVDKITKRVERSILLKNFVPHVTKLSENMYGYEYTEGIRLSDVQSLKQIDNFFEFCKTFLIPNGIANEQFKENCRIMYEKKTRERVQPLIGTKLDNNEIANLLNKIDWEKIVDMAIPYRFHGDFQTDNIILDGEKVKLIDWRDSFGDDTIYGDLYYDLGKLHHSISTTENIDLMLKFKNFCQEQKFDWNHVELLGFIQYITIASLYKDYKWVEFYFNLGKQKLKDWFEKNV